MNKVYQWKTGTKHMHTIKQANTKILEKKQIHPECRRNENKQKSGINIFRKRTLAKLEASAELFWLGYGGEELAHPARDVVNQATPLESN